MSRIGSSRLVALALSGGTALAVAACLDEQASAPMCAEASELFVSAAGNLVYNWDLAPDGRSRCLDIEGWSRAPGSRLAAYERHGRWNQRWVFGA
jgi:hypothetical protein